MKIQIRLSQIGYSTSSAHVEAYRRALEIRQAVLESEGVDPRRAVRRKETFCWETPLPQGGWELETVTIDQVQDRLTYIRSIVAQAC